MLRVRGTVLSFSVARKRNTKLVTFSPRKLTGKLKKINKIVLRLAWAAYLHASHSAQSGQTRKLFLLIVNNLKRHNPQKLETYPA
jgi:hypothetical protein